MCRRTALLALTLLVASGAMSGCGFLLGVWRMFGSSTGLAGSSKATSKPATTTTAEGEEVEPGIYRFTALVEDISIRGTDGHYLGAFRSEKGPILFLDIDPRWLLQLKVLTVEKPIWFLKAGERTYCMVHSPHEVFGAPDNEATGKEYKFAIKIDRDSAGRLSLSHLTTPHGRFTEDGQFRQPRKKKK